MDTDTPDANSNMKRKVAAEMVATADSTAVMATDAACGDCAPPPPQRMRVTGLTATVDAAINDEQLCEMAREWTELCYLDLSADNSVTDNGLHALAQHCTQLEWINVSGCDRITRDGVEMLAQQCPRLVVLIARLYRQNRQVPAVVLHVLRGSTECSTMERVAAGDAVWLGNKFCAALAQHRTRLQHIDLSRCDMVTDTGVQAIAQRCARLQCIALSCCSVTDAGVQALSQGCIQLQHIDLTNCRQVTDAGILALARHCPWLPHIDLANCQHVTDAGVQAPAQYCAQLQHIGLSGCNHATDAGVRGL